MADEAAVLDAPVLETEPIEQEETPVVEAEDEPAAEPVAEVEGDERVIPKWLKNLKASDPDGFKDAKAKFFALRSLDEKLKDFDLDGTKSFLDEHGGRESLATAITELQSKAAELDSINQAITEGKAEILDQIPQESLAKLAPAVAQKWAEADPEGWGRAMSGIMAATITQSGIPSFLNEMGMMLKYGDTESFGAKLQQLQEWAGSFQKQASAPVTAKPTTQGPDVNQERQQWESEKFNTAIREDVEKFRQPQIESALAEYFKRAPKDQDKRELATADVRRKVVDLLSADKDYQSKLNALTARRDREGAMRLLKSREQKAIDEIAPKVGRTIFGQPAQAITPKPAPSATPKIAAPAATGDPRDAIVARWASR